MADGNNPKYEVPAELRAMAERSVEHAKSAFVKYMQAAHEALSAFDNWFKASRAGAHDIGSKAMTFAHRNVQSAFEFARNIAQAQNLEEVTKRQTEYVRSQIQVLGEQAKQVGETAGKLTTEGAKDLSQNAKALMDKLKKLAESVRSP
jgi:phasin